MATQSTATQSTATQSHTKFIEKLPLAKYVEHVMKLVICLANLIHGFSVISVLGEYNQTAATLVGCRQLFERHVQNSGFTATQQFQWLTVAQKAKIIANNPDKADKGVLLLVLDNNILFLASVNDNEPLTDHEIQLLCKAINTVHGSGSASVVTTP